MRWTSERSSGPWPNRALLRFLKGAAGAVLCFSPVAMAENRSLPGADLFNGTARELWIELGSSDIKALRESPREDVRGRVKEADTAHGNVAVHLRGAVGSFRPIDDKPGLTLDFDRFEPGRTFHGLRKIHLNNSVEDPSFFQEQLGARLFEAAGVPAARVGHAVVYLNGRRLGLYVLKEGFTEDFLACHFTNTNGGLYEPGEGHDVNQFLDQKSTGALSQDRAELKALASAVFESSETLRWQRLEQTLDIDRFIAFMAMEVMLCHRDGYCLARNNFRIYEDLDRQRIVFFPHGMDQLLGPADLPWRPHMAGLVARAVLDTPEGQQRYRECFCNLFTNVYRPEVLAALAEHLPRQLAPLLTRSELRELRKAIAAVVQRIHERHRSLVYQLSQPLPRPLLFTRDAAALQGWDRVDAPAGGQMAEVRDQDGTVTLFIQSAVESSASWRTKALLPRGRYRFEGRVRIAGVEPLPYGAHQGAGLRVAGSLRESGNLTGDSGWRTLNAGFQVDREQDEVEFVCELRCLRGEAWFDRSSLRVVRVSGGAE